MISLVTFSQNCYYSSIKLVLLTCIRRNHHIYISRSFPDNHSCQCNIIKLVLLHMYTQQDIIYTYLERFLTITAASILPWVHYHHVFKSRSFLDNHNCLYSNIKLVSLHMYLQQAIIYTHLDRSLTNTAASLATSSLCCCTCTRSRPSFIHI